MKYNVRLEAFEGPLDLLLHLINQAEVDIYDIPMTKITEQYLDYIHAMQELHLDVASEYLVMAATLIAIKSKMLLPKKEELFTEETVYEDEEDPRLELMNRLIEYRKYKEAAHQLKERETKRSYLFTKPPVQLEKFFSEEVRKKVALKGVTLFDMISAYQKLLKRVKYRAPLEKTVSSQEYSLESRMGEILQELKRANGQRTFSSLFRVAEKSFIVVTFLAILELMKNGEIVCMQQENFSDIIISLKKEDFVC